MRKLTSFSLIAASALCFAVCVKADDSPKADAPKLVCPVSGQEATKDHAVKYKKAQLYFCCDDCPKKFAKDKAKYEAKADAQFVVTGQYKQKACPLTGKPINKDATLEVAGAKVSFCCNDCKGAVEALKGDAQIDKVFAKAPFKKGYELAKKAE
jgi:hypothetical protein